MAKLPNAPRRKPDAWEMEKQRLDHEALLLVRPDYRLTLFPREDDT